jgi:hypothetical protein
MLRILTATSLLIGVLRCLALPQSRVVWMGAALMTCMFGGPSRAQEVLALQAPEASADCMGAIRFQDTIGPIKGMAGRGKITEIYNSNGEVGHLHLKEMNSVWLRFEVREDAELTMKIKSVNPIDNFNFALYESPGPWFCQSFANEFSREPIRANMSDKDQGETGLSADSPETLVDFYGSDAFSSKLAVKKGTEYYLLIDSPIKWQEGFWVFLSLMNVAAE